MAKLKSANTVSATVRLNLHTTEALAFINEALLEATQEIVGFDTVETAKSLAPVLPKATTERHPGELRDSIDSRVSQVKKGVKATLRTHCGYGGFVELGTVNMASEPYLYPAFEQNIQRLPVAVKEALITWAPKETFGG
jgi:HK97 gp10 family phage protein